MGRSVKILISAAEASSDAHGAELLRALREQLPAGATLEAFGVGGPKLQEAGLRAVVDARELLAMGFFEIVSRLPRVLRALAELADSARAEKPEIAVVIDYPDFHFRLARRLKALGVPVVYYIPPKVWVWRKKRIRLLKENFAKVLSILPFEEAFYRREKVPVKYVGNPLADELPLALTREQARAHLGLEPSDKVLALLPGSRPSELKRHLELMLDAANRAAALLRASGELAGRAAGAPGSALKVLIPLPLTADARALQARVDAWLASAAGDARAGFILEIRVSRGDAHECLVAADAALVKSGTSTLEAGLLGCPHAVVYKPNWFTQWVFQNLIRYKGPVGLVNLVAGWEPEKPYLVREILCQEATTNSLSDEVVALFRDGEKRARMAEGFRRLRETVIGGDTVRPELSPSRTAAREVMGLLSLAPEGAPAKG